MHRETNTKNGIAAKRKQASWNNEYLLKVLSNWIACPQLDFVQLGAICRGGGSRCAQPVYRRNTQSRAKSSGGFFACWGAAGTVPKGAPNQEDETHKGQSVVKRGQGLGMSGNPVMGLATD